MSERLVDVGVNVALELVDKHADNTWRVGRR